VSCANIVFSERYIYIDIYIYVYDCVWVHLYIYTYTYICICKSKGKAVPSQAWSGPEGSSFPDFVTTAQDGGKVVILTHRPPLPPENTHGTHFC